MKLNFILLILFLFSTLYISGARAYPGHRTVKQPDGTTITIAGHGDEFQHYLTTTDGYTVVKGADGIYRYARLYDGRLLPTAVKARNKEDRTSYDCNFLHSVSPHLKPAVSGTGRKLMMLNAKGDTPLTRTLTKAASGHTTRGMNADLDNYRGLVILVNFTDRKFSRGNRARQMVDDMMNKENRTSYDDYALNARVKCTGSVRDYFSDNSGGLFRPEFDVVGPVEIDVDQYFINGTDRTYELFKKVVGSADDSIDYSRYDSDGDGIVDMVYVLYAGYASIYQGNDERFIWPHAGDCANSGKILTLDGVKFGRFACSSEIYGWEEDNDIYLDDIGVIVHEFSHVLGFKDHYDVSGYLNEDPGAWDVMASGNYNGACNDTPCGYNSYEKFAAGFIVPRTLTRQDDRITFTLRPLSASDDAIRIQSMQDSTVFMLENRQPEKWDRYLPGHGMLVWRVDSCDNEYWIHNALNVNNRLHFKLIRALGATRTLFREIEDTDYDPFPGSRNVCDLTNFTRESDLLSDLAYPAPVGLRDISESDGVITFRVEEDTDADARPYTFRLKETYSASGVMSAVTDEETKWEVRTGEILSGESARQVIYDLIPDTENIAGTDTRYAEGLAAPYVFSGDRRSVIIEPSRVAVTDRHGVWLVDFNDLDNGGSGAIVLRMSPYGDIVPANPDCMPGYCLMDRKSVTVSPERILERISMFRNVRFDATAEIESIPAYESSVRGKDEIFSLQGIRITAPIKNEIYIVNGRKVRF